MNPHETYMQRCLELAKNGLGSTYPNPLVGSVIVYNNQIIGEGWHQKAGTPHAEVHAIYSVKDKSLLKKATIYVNLEPCSHFGKTPPCADLIAKHQIPNVVIGTLDPYVEVAGKGMAKLMANGSKVIVGVLEQECWELNKRFFTFHTKKRPYIILKWAQTQDGFIAPLTKDSQAPVWISNSYAQQLTHKWRSEEQAILVGTQTIIDDNPSLTTRTWSGKNPIRVVIDREGSLDLNLNIFNNAAPTFIFIDKNFENSVQNGNFIKIDFSKNILPQILDHLSELGIQSLIVEGGRQTLQSFIDEGYWDEARIFTSESVLNSGIKAPKISGLVSKRTSIINNQLIILKHHD